MSARVKYVQQGTIDTANFGTRRKVAIQYDEVDSFISSVETRPAPYIPPVITTAPEETIPKPAEGDELYKPFLGTDGEYIWDNKSKLPSFVQDICDQVRAIFSLKSEIEGFSIRIFTPASKRDWKKTYTVNRVPQEAALAVGARIIIPVGSTENLDITVSAGKSRSGSGSIRLLDQQGLMTPIGLAAGADFTWNDGTSGQMPAHKGFRAMTYKKNPIHRYMIVIDCMNNMSVIAKAINDEAKAASGGDAEKEKEIANHLYMSMGINPIDDIAEMAAAVGSKDGEGGHTLPMPDDKESQEAKEKYSDALKDLQNVKPMSSIVDDAQAEADALKAVEDLLDFDDDDKASVASSTSSGGKSGKKKKKKRKNRKKKKKPASSTGDVASTSAPSSLPLPPVTENKKDSDSKDVESSPTKVNQHPASLGLPNDPLAGLEGMEPNSDHVAEDCIVQE